jgi:hypothetical protein
LTKKENNMKNRIYLVLGSFLAACGSVTPSTTGAGGTQSDSTIVVNENIMADTRWDSSKTYILPKLVYVERGTLTIDPGTVIKGKNGSALIVTRDAKLIAEGTAAKPIVFTVDATVGTRGQATNNWGGVMVRIKPKAW